MENTKKKSYGAEVFIIIIATIGLLYGALIFFMAKSGNLSGEIQIPRILSLPYEVLGVEGGAIFQVLFCSLVIIGCTRTIIKVKKER